MGKLAGCAVVGLFVMGCAGNNAAVRGAGGWNDQSAKEAEQAMHALHHAWDKMDMVAVDKAIADDGFLTTFEFTEEGKAVRLANKAELLAWLKQGFDDIRARNASTTAVPQTTMSCKANADMAVCTEECDIIVRRSDGKEEHTPHRGTSVLRKFADGWKFTHWHVSESAPRRIEVASTATPAAH
jgi:ketosteroid isomerase-like protein